MSLAATISRLLDALYLPIIRRFVPPQIFRYGACGATNMALDAMWYFVIYHFVVAKQFVDLGFIVISPHIASLILVFPITFFTGFWLNRNVAFHSTNIGSGRQMIRYFATVLGSITINYLSMKLLVEIVHIWPTPSKLITTVISTIYSYLLGRYYTFK